MLALVLLVNTAALGVTMRLNRSVPGTSHWFAGFGMLCLSLCLLATQNLLHPLVSTVLADSLLVAGYATLWLGVRRFKDDRRNHIAYLFVGLILFALVVSYFSVVQPDAPVRIALVSAVIAVQLAALAREFWRGTGHALISARLTAAVCLGQSLLHLGQAGALIAGVSLESVFQQSVFNQIVFLVGFVTSIMLAFGLIVMTTERLQTDLRRQATVDPLTQLFNRRAFFEAAERALKRTRIGEQQITLVLLDLDHFKAINDTYGHSFGDQVLVQFAETLRGNLRPQDILARFGGEEFVCLLPETGLRAGVGLAERLRLAVEAASTGRDGPGYTVSIGVAEDSDTNLDGLIHKADTALYQAKRDGRNRVVALGPEATVGARNLSPTAV
jgi:diguanylate cyclase (GGDEF)-like protein